MMKKYSHKKTWRASRLLASAAFAVVLLAASPVAFAVLRLWPVDQFTSAHWQADYPDTAVWHWWGEDTDSLIGAADIPTWSLLGWQRNDMPERAVERVQTDWREADTTDCWGTTIDLSRWENDILPAEGSSCFEGSFVGVGSSSATLDSCAFDGEEDEIRQTRNDLLDLDFDDPFGSLPNNAAVGYRSEVFIADMADPTNNDVVWGCYSMFWAAP